jgi:hypothetical protein
MAKCVPCKLDHIYQDADDDQNEEGQCLIRTKSVVLDQGMMASVSRGN